VAFYGRRTYQSFKGHPVACRRLAAKGHRLKELVQEELLKKQMEETSEGENFITPKPGQNEDMVVDLEEKRDPKRGSRGRKGT